MRLFGREFVSACVSSGRRMVRATRVDELLRNITYGVQYRTEKTVCVLKTACWESWLRKLDEMRGRSERAREKKSLMDTPRRRGFHRRRDASRLMTAILLYMRKETGCCAAKCIHENIDEQELSTRDHNYLVPRLRKSHTSLIFIFSFPFRSLPSRSLGRFLPPFSLTNSQVKNINPLRSFANKSRPAFANCLVS